MNIDFKITTICAQYVPAEDLRQMAEACCKELESFGYGAMVKPVEDNQFRIKIRKGAKVYCDTTVDLGAAEVAELSRFAGKAHFQHVIDTNFVRMVKIGWNVRPGSTINATSELVTFERNGEQNLQLYPTHPQHTGPASRAQPRRDEMDHQ